MNILGRVFPGIYEKRFYKRICEILAFIIYALVLMLIFGLMSSNYNSKQASSRSGGYHLAEKINSSMSAEDYSTNNTVLNISKRRVEDFKDALQNKDKKQAADIAAPVIKKAREMDKVEAVNVE